MRESVVFLSNTPVPAAGGGFTDNYTTLCTTRGQLISKSGSRSLSFGVVADNSFMTLRVRFQTTLANALRSDTKIVISGDTYTFTNYTLIDQKKHLYEFQIQAQDN
jgi:hypothetical protein